MSNAKGSIMARIFGTSLFTALSSGMSTEQFNEAETKLAAEIDKGKTTPPPTPPVAAAAPVAAADPLQAVVAATEALGQPGGTAITAEAFKAEQDRATKAEEQVTALTKERDTYKNYFDKHNAQGKVLPLADATTTDQGKQSAVELSDASAQALEYFKGLQG